MAQSGTVTASSLNLRDAPGGQVLRQLPKGATVEIIEDQGDWLRVNVSGEAGFVASRFIDKATPTEPAQPAEPSQPSQPAVSSGANAFRFVGDKAVAPDGTVFAKKFKLGVFNNGATSIRSFLQTQAGGFAGTSPSRLRVMEAVSANEGKLEAINTWDNAFLTFGIFQWTVGSGSGPGELPALLDRLKQTDSALFQKYFGQFGLDTLAVPSQGGAPPTGFLVLNGVKLNTNSLKEQLRSLQWPYRFWISGRDTVVRQVQISHAMSRVDLFYKSDKHKIRSRFIADYITSEFGVALVLDEHVNRPGHVPGTLANAVSRLVAELGSDAPETWTDAQEQRLVDIYIQERAKTNMTDPIPRANNIRSAVNTGLASAKRGSYQP